MARPSAELVIDFVAGPSRIVQAVAAGARKPIPAHRHVSTLAVSLEHARSRTPLYTSTSISLGGPSQKRCVDFAKRDAARARWNSSVTRARSAAVAETASEKERPADLTDEESRAYGRLRPIIDSLPGPVDWAVAYGSGVRHQANSDPTGPPPMTDFLLSTPSLTHFHDANIRQNPSHYPLTARLIGARRVAWLTDNWGAGVWYVTMVKVRGMEVKYGIISTERLKRDLEAWETLYVAGRLHKPVLPLLSFASIHSALHSNLSSALSLSLLLLPPRFAESALWEQIAGISYAGDPRMSVPGAENPEKVKNIISGQGAREGLRGMYGGMLAEKRVRWAEGTGREKGEADWAWRGQGEAMLEQPDDPSHRVSLMESLPARLQERIAARFPPPSDKGTTVSSSAPIPSDTGVSLSAGRPDWAAILSGQTRPVGSAVGSAGQQDAWRKIILAEVSNIIRRPALTQSIKGLFTAGFRKSFAYSLAKSRKWLKGRKTGKKVA